jgi:2-oxoacid:acceptor oxidoreductase delta subunit (pyruvate/2-ketoisovalerate family)
VGGVTRHPGGTVVKSEAVRLRTGGWRTEGRPAADFDKCVNCLLCWLYCPDAAVRLEGSTFVGFDYEVCKGCQICVEMCPTGALAMVPEEEADAA